MASRSWRAPFLLGGRAAAGERVLNLYIWSNYIAPETIKKFEERHDVRVNVDLYDINEALLAKMQSGKRRLRRHLPVQLRGRDPGARRTCLQPLDHRLLPHLGNIDPRFLDRPHDRGNRLLDPVRVGHAAASPTTARGSGDDRLLGGALGPQLRGQRS